MASAKRNARLRPKDPAEARAAHAKVALAYTGARVGEIAQLRKEDIRQEAGHWVIRITPEAGAVKNGSGTGCRAPCPFGRKGLPAFVGESKPGHLFITPAKATGDVLGPLQGIANRLGEQARKVVTAPLVKPNHGWRRRFNTISRSVGIDPRVMDAIQGHAARTAGDDYGDVTIAAIALALSKFPKQYELAAPAAEESSGAQR